MSLAGKIGQNTAIVFSQTIITLIFGAVSAFFIISNLERYQFGLFSLAMSAVWMIAPWIDFGIGQVVSADVAGYIGRRDFAKVKRLLYGFYKTKIFLTFFAFVAAFVASYFLPEKFDRQFIYLFRTGLIIIIVNNFLSLMMITFESHARFVYVSVAQIIESVLRTAAVIILVVFLKTGPTGAMLAYVISTSLAVLAMLPIFLKLLAPLKNVTAVAEPLFKNLIKEHGKFQILSQPLKSAGDNIQVWIIGWLAGINAVAIYQVALQLYNYLSMFLSASESVLVPILSQELSKSIEKGKFIIERMSKYAFWLSSVIMVFSYATVPFVLRFLFGHKYDASIFPFFVILLALPLAGLGVPLRPAFFAFKGQKQILKIHFLTIIFAYPLAGILTYFFRDINGALGFALIFPFTALMALILRVIFLQTFFGGLALRFNRLFSFDNYDGDLLKRIFGVLKNKFVFKSMKNNFQTTREAVENFKKYITGKTLDFGCGRAKYKSVISVSAQSYTTFDMMPGPNVDVVGNVENTPFQNNEFDTVVSTQVLEHVEKPWIMIKEIGRILKQNGKCVLTVPFLVPYHPDPQDNFRYTANGLASMFKNEGFEILECGYYGHLFIVLSEFIHFSFFDPYKKSKHGSILIMNIINKVARFLDRFVKNDKIFANVFIVAKKL